MPVEAKPLFRPDVLRSHLSGFQLPAADRAKLDHWASEISSGRVDRFGAQEILPHFLADFYVGILVYATPDVIALPRMASTCEFVDVFSG